MRIYVVMQGNRLVGARRTRNAARELALSAVQATARVTDHQWFHLDQQADSHGQAHAAPGTTGERVQLICRIARRWTPTDLTVDVADLDA
ncbi:hypothetical protein ACF1GW_39050 [Streptomyces achromogenes]|uniref:hypothetical protein n=1 Tax=Streptomyces achromogenes TaxID=67255 RepID=UPI0036FFBB46